MTTTLKNIKVFIIDDHPMVVEGLTRMLARYPHISIEETFYDGQSLLKGLQEKPHPDLLLLDIQLTDYTGEDLIPLLKKTYPAVKILAVSSVDTTVRVRNLLRSGCDGYVLKNVLGDVLIQAIETILRGQSFVTDSLKEQIFQDLVQLKKEAPVAPGLQLTKREREIVELIVAGYSSKSIAEKLFISFNTVDNHRRHIFRKLNVKNVANLVKKAIVYGIDITQKR